MPLTNPAIASISGGAAVATGPEVVLSNANGVSFGVLGQTVTASVAAGSIAPGGLAAGTQTATSGTIVFSNSNNVSFGMSGSTQITASAFFPAQTTQPGIQSISGGSTRITTGEVVFSNSNNVSFGIDGATITASANFPADVLFGLAAGTETVTTGTVVMSNSNGLSFGLNNSTLTASADGIKSVSAGTTRITNNEVVFADSNGLAFGANGQTITGSYTQSTHSHSTSPGGIAAGTQTATSGTVVFANSNGLTFGMSGSSQITGSYSQSTGPAAVSAGTNLATSGTIVFTNANNVTFGMDTNGSVTASASFPAQTVQPTIQSISAGTNVATTGQVVFANSNGLAFGMDTNGTITGSYTVPSQSTQPGVQAISAGSQTITTGTAVFSNSNNVSFGVGSGTASSIITASASFPAQTVQPGIAAVSAGTQSLTTGTIAFADSNGISFGIGSGANSTRLTASYTVPTQSIEPAIVGLAANGSTATTGTVNFGNLNGISFGYQTGASSTNITASYTVPVQTVQPGIVAVSAGTQSATTGTVIWSNSNGISFGMGSGASTSIMTASYTVPTQSTQPAIVGIQANGSTITTGTVAFSNLNGISFGFQAGASSTNITASYTVPTQTTQPAVNIAVNGATTYTSGTVVFSNSNGVTFGTNGQTITASVLAQSVQTFIGGIAASSQSALTVTANTVNFSNSNGVSFGLGSGANSSVMTASYSQSTAPTAIQGSGTSVVTNGTVQFANSNGLTFGLSGSTITGSYTVPTQTVQPGIAAVSAGTQSATTGTVIWSNSNGISFGLGSGAATSIMTASYTVPTQSTQPAIVGVQANGSTLTTGTVAFNNLNGISFGFQTGASSTNITASYTVPVQSTQPAIVGLAANGSTATTGTVAFNNLNGISFGYQTGASSTNITASYTVPAAQTFIGGIAASSQSALTVTANTVNFSNSNGVSFGLGSGANSSVLTASVAAQSAQTFIGGIAASSQSALTVTANTVNFSNSNGISFGLGSGANSSIMTASYTQSTAPAAIQGSGTSVVTNGTVQFANSNNVTFGLSGSTITASVPSQSAQTFIGGIAASSQSALTVTANTVNFSNLNGVSFGLNSGGNSSVMTASIAAVSAISGIAGSGASTLTNGTLVLSNSNGVTFGLSGSTMTASYSQSTAPGGIAVNAATTYTSGTVVFSNGNGVTFGTNGQTITVSTGTVISYWENPLAKMATSWSGTSNSISVQRMYFPEKLNATRAEIVLNISGSLSGALSMRMNVGLYTGGGSTLNSVSTTSRGLTFRSDSAVSYTAVSGPRSWTIGLGTWVVTPGEYFLALNFGWTTASTNTVFIQMHGANSFPAISGSETGAFANATNYFNTAMINNNAQSTLPDTMQLSGMTQTGNSVGNQPWVRFVGTF